MNQTTGNPVYFHLGISEQPAPPDLLGIWNGPASDSYIHGVEPLVIWHADLPRKQGVTGNKLAANDRLIHQANLALPLAEQRLKEISLPGGAENQPLPPAERKLQEQLEQISALSGSQVRAGAQSYALFGADFQAIIDDAKGALQFFTHLNLALAPSSRVETTIAGKGIGWTNLSWAGDFETCLQHNISQQQADAHFRLVSQALASRQTVVRIGMMAVAGAASLSAGALTGPLAVIAVCNFVKEIIAEIQQSG
jgi:hypothetical protein